MRTPFWLSLLTSWCANREALTLPFIVGADAIRRGVDAVPEDVKPIFDEICHHNRPNSLICIGPCPTLGVPAISVHTLPRTGIQVSLDETWGANDDEKLQNFATDAEHHVRAGRFSRVGHYPNRRWDGFQPEDYEFIRSVIRTYKALPTTLTFDILHD